MPSQLLVRCNHVYGFVRCCFHIHISRSELDAGFERYNGSADAYHEAGWDAYVTGVCYARMKHFIGVLRSLSAAKICLTVTNANAEARGDTVSGYVNKIKVYGHDEPLNLSGPDGILYFACFGSCSLLTWQTDRSTRGLFAFHSFRKAEQRASVPCECCIQGIAPACPLQYCFCLTRVHVNEF